MKYAANQRIFRFSAPIFTIPAAWSSDEAREIWEAGARGDSSRHALSGNLMVALAPTSASPYCRYDASDAAVSAHVEAYAQRVSDPLVLRQLAAFGPAAFRVGLMPIEEPRQYDSAGRRVTFDAERWLISTILRWEAVTHVRANGALFARASVGERFRLVEDADAAPQREPVQ